MKSSKLLQQIAKLEEQVAVMSQDSSRMDKVLSAERAGRSTAHLSLQESIDSLQRTLEAEQRAGGVLRSEIRDLRLVLQSSDKELAAVKAELSLGQGEQQKEMGQLSSTLITTQLQLDNAGVGSSSWSNTGASRIPLTSCRQRPGFEADQARQQLQDSQQEATSLRAQITVSNHANIEQNLALAKETVNALEQKIEQDKGAMVDLFNQTRDLRSELSEKEENLAQLSGDITDLTAKHNTVTSEREEVREQNSRMQTKLQDLKEEVGKMMTSSRIEDETLYATEEVERLTKVLDEQNGLLQTFQEQANQKDAAIQNLQQQTPCTPRSFIADQELESCHSSMVSMEILLMEHNSERASKNEEIQRLKTQLSDIQGLLEEFYRNPTSWSRMGIQMGQSSKAIVFPISISVVEDISEQLNETIKQAMLKDLQEELAEKAQESMFAQSQTSVQELTSQLRDRCLELRELSLKEQEQEKLLNEVEILRKQVDHLSEENGKLVGHHNHKQRIEYLVKLKRENTKLQEVRKSCY
ncbi:hypothetical protein CRUP_005858 [Coryphaenoides rupestris]|nr:hypothetical protein CRUP_005858 [Coryphaenoides rupestris]